MAYRQSSKLSGVCYEIRGPVNERANELEAAGHRILRLNTGNPAAFGFSAPESVRDAVTAGLDTAHGYSDARGLLAPREHLTRMYEWKMFPYITPDRIWLGNGVSELAQLAVHALLDDGDEVLIPSPDYPLWTAVTQLSGGRPVHYRCDETAGWLPDLDDVATKITDRTRAIVVITPNNPTGAVYPKEMLEGFAELARRHRLVVFADEIYERIVYDGVHHHLAALAPDVLTVTFSGLSKSHQIAGYRAGWMAVTGPVGEAKDYLEGVQVLASMRLCPNLPAQTAISAALLDHSIRDLCAPEGRLYRQSRAAWEALTTLPGVTCVRPEGALYAFPRIDPEVYDIADDEQLVLDLLEAEKIQVVQGSGFNHRVPHHFRIITLPNVVVLGYAVARIGEFLRGHERAGQAA